MIKPFAQIKHLINALLFDILNIILLTVILRSRQLAETKDPPLIKKGMLHPD